jgi:hypothetical protein
MPKRPPKKRRRLRLEAEEICLVDQAGVERMTLMIDEDGRPSITLRDKRSRSRVIIALRSDGTPHVSLSRESGHPSVGFGEDEHGRVGVGLHDKDGQSRIMLVIHPDNDPDAFIVDAAGKTVWKAN